MNAKPDGETKQSLLHDISDSELASRISMLAKFKAYVHQRLDDAGIPKDPESPHKAEGCRIGGRLDIVLNSRAELLEACKKALTCASLDSSVRELVQSAIARAPR